MIKIGDVFKLGIVKFGRDGDPIMIHEGFVIFLKNIGRGVQLNTMVEIKITKVFPNYAFAEMTNG